MINFFRKIRQNLLSEGKTGKPTWPAGRYFKYAIGEIVLVVIGILIALQINNWNEVRKEKNVETQYVKNMIRDLNEQLNSIEVQMENEQSYYEAASYILEDYNELHAFILDSAFYKRATLLANRKTFIITDPTFTDLISSGNLHIIKNQSIKDKLLNYYQELERIEKVIQNNNSLLIDQHYMFTFLKKGYHYENLDETIGESLVKFPGHLVKPEYQTDIQQISNTLILKDENKLELMNAITLRHGIALGHYEFLINAKSDTKSLIEEMKNE